ncbi:MAG: hypothetical protein EOO39_13230, partial [Cytophagaceae bacterium]
PVIWDQVKVLNASRLGENAILAKRKGSTWYIACITSNAASSTETISLDFLDKNVQYHLTTVSDQSNDTGFKVSNSICTSTSNVPLQLLPNGGAVIMLKQKGHDL